jgi:hypothetical protein
LTAIHVDSHLSDPERRARLYGGALFLFRPHPAVRALAEHARAMIEAAFAPHDPQRLHQVLSAEACVETLAELKPAFIHHPQSKALIRELLGAFGCAPETTSFDVPRLRSAFPAHFLSAGLAYAFHPHRDTWYSAPFCQQNWWLPVYDFEPGNGLAFHPRYWTQPLRNGSRHYNYYRWNAQARGAAAAQVKADTRPQPKAEEPVELEPDLRPIVEAGGKILFSAAQLHSTVANTTDRVRWSIDFRVVDAEDARQRIGAPNVDSESTGTTMRDYLRVSDLSRLPDEIVALYDDGVPEGGLALWPAGETAPA